MTVINQTETRFSLHFTDNFNADGDDKNFRD